MTARRFFTAAGVIAVAAVAGAISYRHQQHLSATHGQTYALSLIWPLCVDGLVASTGIAIATDRAAGFRPRLWALAGFWLGVIVSVLTNWLATSGGIVNHGVSAFPALAFLLAVESLSSKPRKAKISKPPAAPVEVAELIEVQPEKSAPTATAAAERSAVAAKPRKTTSAAAKVAAAARKMPDATAAQIAAKVGVSESTARRHLAATVAPVSAPPVPAVDQLGTAPFELFGASTVAAPVNGHDVLTGASA